MAKLQQSRFDAFETQQNVIDRILLRNYKAAYEETIGQMAKLYAKVGLKTPVDGMSIRKEDAIRYNQFQNRLDNLAAEMKGLRAKGVKLTEETSAQAVQDAYYGGQWAFEQAVSVPLPIPALPISVIRVAVYSDVSGLDLVKTWDKNTIDGIYKTQAAMMRGLTQGYSYAKMASAIKGEFDKGLWQAMRVVRTEAGRCWSEGAEAAHQAASEAGLNVRKRWSAALDRRTRLDHAALDGTYADDEGLFHIGGLSAPQPREFGDPAQDISCRCNAYDVLDGIEPSVRRIRDDYTDPKSGSSICPYQTFEQWATKYGWTKEKGWPKKGK
ncbi:phage head morphogenesis protein [Patescibacteria group bacterium]|nr:phage head morphogenesis protein [Patescibacteria group bacterium]